MIIKNRKLIRRDDLGPIADYIDLDRLKADAEAAMLEIPTDFWYGNANEADSVDNLFVWLLTDKTPHPIAFWRRVHRYFTVEPLPIYTTRLAEIDGEIARLTAEREKLAKPTGEESE